MFLEKQIEEMGSALLKQASLEGTTRFSIVPEPGIDTPHAFVLKDRTVYCIPEWHFYDFKANSHRFCGRFGAGQKTYLETAKISISHEIGHAMQSDLKEKEQVLRIMKSGEALKKIKTADELLEHAALYKRRVIEVEEDAWEKAWELIKGEINEELFDLIKRISLESYKSGDFIDGEDPFYDTFQNLLVGEDEDCMEVLGIDGSEDGQIFRVRIHWDGEFVRAQLLEKDGDYHWLEDKSELLDKTTDSWEPFPVWRFSDLAAFAAENLKNPRKMRF